LIFSGYHNRYFAFFQKTTDRFRKSFQHLVEAGIYMRWEQESVGWVHSSRMQHRFKLVSKTKVIDDFDEIKFYALKMEGSILRPFILYVVCILVFIVCFLIEVMLKRKQLCILNFFKVQTRISKFIYSCAISFGNIQEIEKTRNMSANVYRFIKIRCMNICYKTLVTINQFIAR
jgi:hypothetical protein